MSAPAIEARSLSLLTALAANPPAYPRNPTHVKHDPLVLYIARVPGSKDVFLSPMRPRDKVVTAEDVQSSLYYVHVDQPGDAILIDPETSREPQDGMARRPSPSRPSATVQRKAVPKGAGAALPSTRKPVSGTLTPISNFASRQNAASGNSGMLEPSYRLNRSYGSNLHFQENRRPVTSTSRSFENPQQYGTSLTLIRRDPASGAQWNVARIEDPSALDISSASGREPAAKRKPGAPMYIEVFNPGYSKFLHTEQAGNTVLPTRDGDLCERSSQVNLVRHDCHTEQSLDSLSTENSNTFRRRVWMEGTQHAYTGFGHRKNQSSEFATGRPDAQASTYNHGDRSLIESQQQAPAFLTREDQAYSTIQVTDRQTTFRGYVFSSPWSGRCEFVTGTGGGSLKCRHIVPGLQGALPAALNVSELRFNLPSTFKAATPKADEQSKRSSFFNRGRHSRSDSTVSVNREGSVEEARYSLDRLDLSLGQEFAGGGFGGKQAKLGKLILEDEGLKMMDLLVAANLGLWWRAYEKANAGS
ncbi:hypothetical protein ACN47E_003903 [Coniothyrium glycines]